MTTPRQPRMLKKQKPVISVKKIEKPNKRVTNSLGMKFVLIPAGTFMMGPDEENEGWTEDNKTLHQVTIEKPFYLQTTPVTQRQWASVMGKNPSHFKGHDDLPVENVSWSAVQKFILTLNNMEDARRYRLPTEAEWEYACRAGSKAEYCFGDDPGELGEYAWYEENSDRRTHPVGRKKPNAWRLYDMHGNVWEWVKDFYDDYPESSVTDPVGRSRGFGHVFRGGSCYVPDGYCSSAFRGHNDPGSESFPIGFRLLRTISL